MEAVRKVNMANVTVDIINETNSDISVYEEVLHNAAAITLDYEKFDYETEVSITIANNDFIRKLNKKYRNVDSITDVLSFPCHTFTAGNYFLQCSNMPVSLGDIVICLPKAVEQAEEYGHSLLREIYFLVCHSILHLLGYDHIDDVQREVMFAKQKEILDSAGITR